METKRLIHKYIKVCKTITHYIAMTIFLVVFVCVAVVALIVISPLLIVSIITEGVHYGFGK